MFGSDHPADLLHNQNLNLIWNFSPFLDVQMHILLDTPRPCLYMYSFRDILLAGIGGKELVVVL